MTDASEPTNRPGASASPRPGVLDRDGARAFALDVAASLAADRCEDVTVLDVSNLTTVTACIVVASGTSDRQMRAALKHLNEVADGHGTRALHVSSDDNATWLLADFVDVVVHLFEPNARAYYDLEMMWAEAPRLDPPAPTPRDGDRA